MRSAFGERFDVPAGYLNTASIGIPSATVADAVAAAIGDWRCGAAQPFEYDAPVAAARAGFGALVGFPADRVAIGASVSALVGQLAASVPDRCWPRAVSSPASPSRSRRRATAG
jgi:hypothetical protein